METLLADASPGCAGHEGLHEEFGDVGGAVAQVGGETEDNEGFEGSERQGWAEMRPSEDEPQQNDRGEDCVVR